MQQENSKTTLQELAKLFTKLGLIGFGGPAVHIAMMEQEVVRKRKWMDHQHFLDLVGATNLIPGPNSTELTMHIGKERAGWKGFIVAGSCFIIPAVIITAAFAWAYLRFGHLPQVQPFIYGIKPAIISVVAVAMYALGKKALKSFQLGVIGVMCMIAVLLGANEVLVLFGAGAVGVVMHVFSSSKNQLNGFVPFILLQAASPAITSSQLFWMFLKIGSILYGSGYVLFAFLDAELVAKNILTSQQLVDAIAVGQFTPGPVFSSATFIGWQLGGASGALAATTGIFLPSFLLVALLNPIIPRLRQSRIMAAFFDTVNMASVAIVFSVLIEMSRHIFLDWRSISIAVASIIVTIVFKQLNTAVVVLGGAIAGYLLWLL